MSSIRPFWLVASAAGLGCLVSCRDEPERKTSKETGAGGVADTSADSGGCLPEPEVCDGVDNDCNGEIDESDADGDGWLICDDCNDEDAFINPDAAEACDGVDNDCSGAADEPWDADGDGQSACGGDCNDADPYVSAHLPEVCDGRDNNCDGVIDEGFDSDGDGVRTCEGDCDDSNAEVWFGATEVCDGVDNDCDPSTDESADVDGDGSSICDGDCNDHAPGAAPGLVEVCDGLDNDCNGRTDELPACYDCTVVDGYWVCLSYVTQLAAVSACDEIGGSLVILETPEESDLVGEIVARYTTDRFWIALTDRDAEGEWVWGDGTSLDYTSRWSAGEPNDSGGEDCVHNNWRATGYWNDCDCSSFHPFVCEGVP